jgi:hypothetical protein
MSPPLYYYVRASYSHTIVFLCGPAYHKDSMLLLFAKFSFGSEWTRSWPRKGSLLVLATELKLYYMRLPNGRHTFVIVCWGLQKTQLKYRVEMSVTSIHDGFHHWPFGAPCSTMQQVAVFSVAHTLHCFSLWVATSTC